MATLNNAADSQSSVSMPVRGRMIQRADGSLETQLVRTSEIGTVPVVRAALDKDTGYWGYSLPMMPGVNGQTILVSPSDAPGVNATAKGKYSGRLYDPDNSGGTLQNLDWHEAIIDQTGIDKVKLHTGRFGESADNTVMIERLERILRGELQVTDTDKRYYTHEIRELERYRALGISDNVSPDDGGTTWNNTHTATLEDYKLNDDTSLLYTPEADKAYEEQNGVITK